MFKNYLKVAYRNLINNKTYSFINIFGLAIGLATCIIILLYVSYELKFDKHHEDSERIYRVTSHIDFAGNSLELASTSAPMGPVLKESFPEVEAMTRLRPKGSYLVSHDSDTFRENKVVYADSTFFKVFTVPLINGDSNNSLKLPYTVAISEKIAQKYFGNTQVIGETITFEDQFDLEVTAVFQNMPSTSHFQFDFLVSMNTIEEANNNTWLSNNFRTYIKLKAGSEPESFEQQFNTIKRTHIEPQLIQFMGVTIEEFEEAGNKIEYRLQPLENIHLHSNLTGEFEPNGNISYVYIFSGLAIFILLLACINFMNLSTARSSKRAKEVGVRKSLGAPRSLLAKQFLVESIIISFLALFVALFLVELTLPFFSELAGRTIDFSYFANYKLSLGIIGIVIFTGFMAGAYPAILLSSFQPVNVLKGTFIEQKGHGSFRKGLIVFQFSISIVIITGLLVINKQLNYIQNKDLGFNKEQVVILEEVYSIGNASSIESFRNELLSNSFVESATISSFFPVQGYSLNDLPYWPDGDSPSQSNTVSLQSWSVDHQYIETLGMKIKEGRNFSEDRSSDLNSVILNEAAVKQLGLNNPIGKSLSTYNVSTEDGSVDQSITVDYEIIGVVNDFHYQSLKENIDPLALINKPSTGNIAIKYSGIETDIMLQTLETEWNRRVSDQTINYTFLDQQFEQMYKSENRVQNLMFSFSTLAIIIACFGLFGLSTFNAEKRSKEIGIRKILGANTSTILSLISKEFLFLIILSFLISIPIAYLIMQEWLQQFIYKAQIGYFVFIISGLVILGIAFITVSWQSLKAALANPIDAIGNQKQ